MSTFPEVYSIGSHFRLGRLKEFEPDFDHFPLGHLVMWEEPKAGVDYTIGVDPSWGVGQDWAAIHVLKNGTVHWKDAQVAEFAANDMNVHDLTPVCYMLGNLYKNTIENTEALMSVECNISDDIVQQLRNTYNYSNLFIWKYYDNIKSVWSNKLGWWTSARTRPKIIVKGVHYIKQNWWDVPSPWLLSQMQTIEKLDEKQKVQAAAGFKDDLVMAAIIALWSAHDMEFNELLMLEETAKTRDRRFTEMVKSMVPDRLLPISERKDFINTACSVEDMEQYEFPERG